MRIRTGYMYIMYEKVGDRSFVFMPVKRLDYAHVVQMQYQKDMEATAGSLGDSV